MYTKETYTETKKHVENQLSGYKCKQNVIYLSP